MARTIALGTLILAWLAAACIDMQAGEEGYYDSPCYTVFSSVLLCDRETGGVDPYPGAPGETDDGVFDCTDACDVFLSCGFLDPDEVAECVVECSVESTPEELMCIQTRRCEFWQCFAIVERRDF